MNDTREGLEVEGAAAGFSGKLRAHGVQAQAAGFVLLIVLLFGLLALGAAAWSAKGHEQILAGQQTLHQQFDAYIWLELPADLRPLFPVPAYIRDKIEAEQQRRQGAITQ